jgi:glycosyltransferase involved in cell wall biosynthesis
MTGSAAGGARLDSVDARVSDGLPQVTYISWAESCSRSDHTARELGGRSHMVYLPEYGSKASTILFKYLGQWRATAQILRQERPEVVFVMTPPLFASLPAFLYAWRNHARVVLDAHSAAFLHPRWRHLQWLQRWLCRRSATTLVHNMHIAELVGGWGASATLVPDVPVIYEDVEPFDKPEAFTVVAVCSFNYDEPIAEMFAAAALVPDVRFFVTGNPKHLPAEVRAAVPANVVLTGFVSTAAFGGLLIGADAVMTLTTRDHTMLRGAYEAIYQGTPVIVSDWPILREFFAEGALHVDNTATGIASAIRDMQTRPAEFRNGARRLREHKLAAWRQTRHAILDRLVA